MSKSASDPILALPPEQRLQAWADKAWPLRFDFYSFDARAYNVQRCSILFDRHQHGSRTEVPDETTGRFKFVFTPSGPPRAPDWKDDWSGTYLYIPEDHAGQMFATPVDLDWMSLDGTEHTDSIDLDAIFPERRVLHKFKRGYIPVGWLAIWSDEKFFVDVLLEINNRTVNVYMRANIVFGDPDDLENMDKRSSVSDLILAWTKTY